MTMIPEDATRFAANLDRLVGAVEEVLLISHEGERHVPKATKHEVAGAILDRVQELLADRS